MSKILKRYWYKVSLKEAPTVVHICCVENYSKAERLFGVLAKNDIVSQLTWGQVSELTGCLVPPIYGSGDFAKGSLTFRRGSRLAIIWPSVI